MSNTPIGPCAQNVRAAVRLLKGPALSDTEADAIVNAVTNRARAKARGRAAKSKAEAAKLAARELTAEEVLAALQDRRQKLYALRAKARRTAYIEAYLKNSPDGNANDAIQAFNVGELKGVKGTSLSVDAQYRGIAATEYLGPLVKRLDAEGLTSRFVNFYGVADREFERNVVAELSRRNGGKIAATGSADAVKAAEILGELLEKARLAQNAEGAFIGKLEGYVAAQRHDPIKVSGGFFKGTALGAAKRAARQRAGFEAWREVIEPLLDERTFEDIADRGKFLEEAWADIVSGNWEKVEGATDLQSYTPQGSLARQVSARRVFHFKDADAWYRYHQRFGTGSLIGVISGQLDRAARNIALLRNWGPSPEAAFKNALDDAPKFSGAEDRALIEPKDRRRSEIQFGELNGANSVAGNPRLAQIGRVLRTQQSLAKLGGVVLSSFSDKAYSAQVLLRAGANAIDAYGAPLASLTGKLAGAPNSTRDAVADALGVAARGQIGHLTSRYAAEDGALGVLGWAQSLSYRLQGFELWVSGERRGVADGLARLIGRETETAFDALDGPVRANLERYGIDAADWDLTRRYADDIGGSRFVTPDAVDAVPDAALRAAYGIDAKRPQAVVDAARRDLRTKWSAFFLDQVDDAQNEARAAERALIIGDNRPGTVVGEFLRAITQFKSFSVTAARRHVLPGLRGVNGVPPVAQVGHLLVGTTLLGALSIWAKDLARGLTPHSPVDENGNIRPAFVSAAFLQGGGLGIFGDLIAGQRNRFGQGALETLSGPLIGEASSLYDLLKKAQSLDPDVGSDAIRLGIRNTPFLNIFYFRAALNYLFIDGLQDYASPGYRERYEDRLRKETGQEFLFDQGLGVGNN